MSVFLSYSPRTPFSLTSVGSNKVSLVCGSLVIVVVDKISSLMTTPVSFRPLLLRMAFASLANLFTLPSDTASAKSINFSSNGLGGIKPSCLTSSFATKASIISSGSLPSCLNLSPNSCGVSAKPSAFLAISNS